MKKFASFKVFRIAFFIALVICPAANFLSQDTSVAFQNPIKKCWAIRSESINDIASDNELLILQNENGEITRIEKNSGEELWKTSIGEKNNSIISLRNTEDINLFSIENKTGSEDNLLLRKLDPQTGIIKELIKVDRLDKRFSFEILKGLIITQKYPKADNLVKFFGRAENPLKIFDKESSLQIALFNSESYVISDGSVVAQIFLDSGNTKLLYKTKSEMQKISLITTINSSLIWGDESGNFFQKKSETVSPTRLLRTGGRVVSIQESGNNLLITSNDNFIYLYSLTKKKLLWKKRLSGRTVISPKVEDKFAVITTNAAPELIFIDLESGKSFNQIIFPDETFIKDFQVDKDSIFILTSSDLIKFSEKCQ